ncbi:uncharacterized protein BCR38DRAFT_523711 [Pseudomassariella vexata]|uniref:Glycoside hydrolase n=1 Tax=Pseudomassariella vexata TaxID=1141098 RepID=A0A1Y2E0Z4_9PEZI|nr:uncharacterized protein BCR38DRAFT_523711 [Pseudomassariella vexata]ORY65208.1 hypothetical protein BCR38DRAFT_523711 [Pseudomassariella vexata]
MSQLPAEARGVAAGVLIYSLICLIANFLMFWLVWTHNERLSYVALISYFAFLATTCSIIQQVHDNIQWRDVITLQFENTSANPASPVLALGNGSTGADLILFYIQYYCYIVEATLVLFWAFSLTQSVYGWSEKHSLRRSFAFANLTGKIVSVILPAIAIGLLQSKVVQGSFIAFMLVADLQFAISVAGGGFMLLMILIKYIQTRRQFKAWSVDYGKNSRVSKSSPAPRISGAPHLKRSLGIYDRWLVVRFTSAFVVLFIFEFTNVWFQITAHQNNIRDARASSPDFSASRARKSYLLDIPGVSASLLSFLMFGTTKPFRDKMYTTFIPKRFQRRSETATLTNPSYGANANSTIATSRRSQMSGQLFPGFDFGFNTDELRNSGAAVKASDSEFPVLPSMLSSRGEKCQTWV